MKNGTESVRYIDLLDLLDQLDLGYHSVRSIRDQTQAMRKKKC